MPHDSDPTSDLPAKRPLHDATTASAAPSPRAEPAEHTLPRGAVFGHYTIEDVLGAGGMGVVYRARQERPAREVALKVIRPGFASSQALRRFELEAEVLGRLQHPGIAQVYEAGTGPGGQPFFAMELVRGEPLTRFAEARELSTRARLELFARVCDAVQHAHTKGVIHRDLKPGNILVDSGGQPKILDFGVARLTQHDVQAVTIQTDIGQLIGTVPYMSPEQVEGDPANLDTRSDVYALGVILFELLTGRLPYDLSKKLIHEAARIIREDEPTRLSSINRTLRGDIETIALKALEKDKGRRYQAASDLGSDITRFLRDEPIVARPASRSYQLRKFAKRNKALVGGVAAAFVLLVAGLAGTSYGLVRAEERRREAVAAREAETAQRTIAETKQREAQTQAARAEAVNHFFNNDLLGSIDPDQSRGRDITVREVVDIAASHVTGAFTDEPEVEMRVRESIGGTYERLGASEQAREQLQRALSLAEQLHGGVSEATASIVDALARTYRLDARVPEAIQMVQRLLSIRETLNGPDDPRTIVARGDLSAYLATSRGDNAAPLDELTLRMLAGMRQKGESPAQIAAHVQQVTATITGLWKAGRRDEVFNLVRRECEPAMSVNLLRERVPLGLSGYALRLFQEGNLDGADAMATASDRIACEVFGPGHSSRLFARYVHGMMRGLLGDREECARLLEPAYREACQTLGEESDLLEQPRTNLLTVLSDLGRYEEVESIALRALDARVRHDRRDTPHTQDMRGILGDTYLRQHRAVEAEPLIVECYRSRVLEARSGRVALAAGAFSEAYFRIIALRNFQGRVLDAESLACEGLELLVQSPADGQLAIVVMKSELASIFLSEGRPDEALAIMRGTLEQSIAREGRGSKKTIMCAALLYEAYHDLHEDNHARALLDQFGPQVAESIR